MKKQDEIEKEQIKKLYDEMVVAVHKQAEYLLKQYEDAKKSYDGEKGHFIPMSEPDVIRAQLFAGSRVEGIYPKKLQSLIDQMNAVSRTIDSLKFDKFDHDNIPDYYKKKLKNMHQSLIQPRPYKDGNNISDLNLIQKDLSPFSGFKKICYAIISIINPGFAIEQIEKRGYLKFWKPQGYRLSSTAKKTNKLITEIENKPFPRKP